MIDVLYRTEAYAQIRGHPYPTYDDLRSGLTHGMRGRVRARSGDSFAQNSQLITTFIDKNLEVAAKRSATVYWCRFFNDKLKGNTKEGEALVAEGRRIIQDAEMQQKVASSDGLFPRFKEFTRYVGERDALPGSVTPVTAAVGTFALLDKFSLFTCEGGVDDDQP